VVPTAVGAGGPESTAKRTGGECSGSSGTYDRGMANRPNDLPPGSAVVTTNPDEDCSPAAFHAFLDDLVAGPEPELERLGGAQAYGSCA
jgi:hypothetical protein